MGFCVAWIMDGFGEPMLPPLSGLLLNSVCSVSAVSDHLSLLLSLSLALYIYVWIHRRKLGEEADGVLVSKRNPTGTKSCSMTKKQWTGGASRNYELRNKPRLAPRQRRIRFTLRRKRAEMPMFT
ncbi:hypothetical protein CDEST_10459 [Colletotrichum destructivum]|uniref:Uncharacterized protein n=1 Tax=Colletotrichum destructivum TaxID=34406 RepID=A0AAX4IPU8_9PEZI|nr:hypothetical protein CDEST_10459 [Colletotrichum destructivum]